MKRIIYNKKLEKIFIILIIFMLLFSFVFPNVAMADLEDVEFGSNSATGCVQDILNSMENITNQNKTIADIIGMKATEQQLESVESAVKKAIKEAIITDFPAITDEEINKIYKDNKYERDKIEVTCNWVYNYQNGYTITNPTVKVNTDYLTKESIEETLKKSEEEIGKVENEQPKKSGKSVFDDSVTLEWNYEEATDKTMAYGYFTPSNADELEPVPLIVWLHGNFFDQGGANTTETTLHDDGLPKVFENWDNYNLEGFSAYVLCPHLTGKYYGDWLGEDEIKNLREVIEKFIDDYNVDTDNIVLTGHSMGGQGAFNMAYNMSSDKFSFSKVAVFSGYSIGPQIAQIKMPMICYAGLRDPDNLVYWEQIKDQLDSENCFELDSDHGSIISDALLQDDGSCVGTARKWTI